MRGREGPSMTKGSPHTQRAASDLELMEHADGELDDPELTHRLTHDPDGHTKVEAIKQISELVRGHLELSADAAHDAKFTAMWRRLDDTIGKPRGVWARVARWFDHYRGHVITGAVSAGAVAALALILRPSAPTSGYTPGPVDVRPVALRQTPEIDLLDTPGGSSTVINLDDEDGHTTVIWMTPADTVEGI
jgi:anti-sigma factor RsiW